MNICGYNRKILGLFVIFMIVFWQIRMFSCYLNCKEVCRRCFCSRHLSPPQASNGQV